MKINYKTIPSSIGRKTKWPQGTSLVCDDSPLPSHAWSWCLLLLELGILSVPFHLTCWMSSPSHCHNVNCPWWHCHSSGSLPLGVQTPKASAGTLQIVCSSFLAFFWRKTGLTPRLFFWLLQTYPQDPSGPNRPQSSGAQSWQQVIIVWTARICPCPGLMEASEIKVNGGKPIRDFQAPQVVLVSSQEWEP